MQASVRDSTNYVTDLPGPAIPVLACTRPGHQDSQRALVVDVGEQEADEAFPGVRLAVSVGVDGAVVKDVDVIVDDLPEIQLEVAFSSRKKEGGRLAVQMACQWIEDQVRHGFFEWFSEKLQLLGKFNRTIVGQNLVRCVMSMQEGTQSRKVGCNAVADAESDIVVRIEVGNSGDEVEKDVASQSGVQERTAFADNYAKHFHTFQSLETLQLNAEFKTKQDTPQATHHSIRRIKRPILQILHTSESLRVRRVKRPRREPDLRPSRCR